MKNINIITGKNGTGKSSFLESVYLLCGAANAGMAMVINNTRGDNVINMQSERSLVNFFRDMNFDTPINLEATVTSKDRTTRRLTISAIIKADISVGRLSSNKSVHGLKFSFSGPSGHETSEIKFNPIPPQNVVMPGTAQILAPPINIDARPQPDAIDVRFISPYYKDLAEQSHIQINNIIKAKKISDVIDVMKIIEEKISGISSINDFGQQVIYVDVGGPVLLPLTNLGAGFSNLLYIALAVHDIGSGVLIIDEVENGIHYSLLPVVSRFLIEIASRKNIQIFVATHSADFLKAFFREVENIKFDDACLFRFSRNGDRGVTRFGLDDVALAEELNAELR